LIFLAAAAVMGGEIALIGRKFDRLKRRDNELPRLMTHIVYHIQSIFTIAKKFLYSPNLAMIAAVIFINCNLIFLFFKDLKKMYSNCFFFNKNQIKQKNTVSPYLVGHKSGRDRPSL
jgi:hypothetical protein